MGLRKLGTVLALSMTLGLGAASADAWRDGRPMEGARTQVQAVSVSGEIYVAGGSSILGPRDEFEVYDPIADHWRAMPAMPKGREMFGMAALGPVIYVAGGVIAGDLPRATNEAWAFDTRNSLWRRAPNLPAKRVGLALASSGGAIYAVGGTGDGAERVLVLEQNGSDWEPVGDALSPKRSGHAVAVNGSRIFIVGGRSADGALLSSVGVFDTKTGKWRSLPAMPKAAMSLAADFIDGQLHVVGGMVPSERRTLADHYALDVGSGSWKRLAPLPTPRQGLSSAAINNEWYVIGGGSGSGAYTVFTASDAVEVWRP